MPWYNSDFSLAWNIFAHGLVVAGAIVAVAIFFNVCWWLFCQTFKFVDRVVNDYHYN